MPMDLGKQALEIQWKAAKISVTALKDLMLLLLQNRNNPASGKQSLKKLNRQGKKLENVEISGDDMKSLQRELKRNGVDFALKRNPETKNLIIFFKGQDINRVYQALQKCVDKSKEREGKKPIQEVLKDLGSIAQKQNRERQERVRDKVKGGEER